MGRYWRRIILFQNITSFPCVSFVILKREVSARQRQLSKTSSDVVNGVFDSSNNCITYSGKITSGSDAHRFPSSWNYRGHCHSDLAEGTGYSYFSVNHLPTAAIDFRWMHVPRILLSNALAEWHWKYAVQRPVRVDILLLYFAAVICFMLQFGWHNITHLTQFE